MQQNPVLVQQSSPMSWEESVRWLRCQPQYQNLVVDSYYDDPLIDAARRYSRSEEWQAIVPYLPASGNALDVGAGRGIASFALASQGFQVTALEPDGSALVGADAIRGLARDSSLAISVVQSKSERLPFEDHSFDVVFGRAVLHHTSDLSLACREFFRVLKRGGVLIAIREHVLSKARDLDAFLAMHPLHVLYGGENAFLLSHYLACIENAGFGRVTALAPLLSPINLAPNTPASLRRKIASQASFGNRTLASVLGTVLDLPGVWRMASRLLTLVDHRPGRLYSFIAYRS